MDKKLLHVWKMDREDEVTFFFLFIFFLLLPVLIEFCCKWILDFFSGTYMKEWGVFFVAHIRQ